MKEKETVECPNCGQQFTKKGFMYHKRECDRIYSIKDALMHRYYECKNCETLHKEFDVGINSVRKYLKMWGVILKEPAKPKPINTDGRGVKIEFNENYFDEMGNKQYWLIGLLAADGYANKNNNQFGIAQSGESGKNLIEYIKNELNVKKEIKGYKTSGKISYYLNLSSEKIRDVLKNFNIVPNKTYIYTFPDNIPEEYLSSFLAGYIEGDGCISRNKTMAGSDYLSVSFVGTPDFIDKCYEITPIKGSVMEVNHSFVKCIAWGGAKAIELCDWLYSCDDLYHSYKYENYMKSKVLYESSELYKRRKAHDNIIKLFNEGMVTSYTEMAEKFNIKRDLVRDWIYKAYNAGLLTKDYKYLRNT